MWAALRSTPSRLACSCGSALQAVSRSAWPSLPSPGSMAAGGAAPTPARGYFTKSKLSKPKQHRYDMLRTMGTQLAPGPPRRLLAQYVYTFVRP